MGMRAVHNKKGGIKFKYTGDLAESIRAAEEELEEKKNSQKRMFLMWQKDRAIKEFETYERRIDDLRSFISLGKEELEKKREQETNKNEREDHNGSV